MLRSMEQVSVYLQFGTLLGNTYSDGLFQVEDLGTLSIDEVRKEITVALDAVLAQMRSGQRLSIEITGRN